MKLVTRLLVLLVFILPWNFGFHSSALGQSAGVGGISLWDASNGQPLRISLPNNRVEDITAVAFSPSGRTLAIGSATRVIDIWDIGTSKKVVTFTGHKGSVQSLAFSPDGRILASGSWDRTIKLWSVSSQKPVVSLGQSAQVLSVAFSPDGRYLASGGGDAKVCVWNVLRRKSHCGFAGHSEKVNSVAFSSDSKLLASGSDDRTVKVWEVQTGKLLLTLEGHLGSVESVAFNSRDNTLASAGSDKTIRIWDILTGGEISSLLGHLSSIDEVAFSPDGKTLASGSYDKTIKLWDVPSGKALRTLEGHSERITALAFSPDGKILASGSALNRAQSPILHVLAVGVSNYYKGHGHVPFAAKDAIDFAAALERTGRTKFERISVRVLTDYSASEMGIFSTINKIINEAEPQDVFVLFFAGWAGSAFDPEIDAEQFYLFGADGNGISQVTLKSWLTRVEARHQLVVLETKDSQRGYELLIKELAEEDRTLKGLLKRDLVILANSFQGNPPLKLKNSFLTHTLLDGLAGQAAAESGELTVKGLVDYAKARQSTLSKAMIERIGSLSSYEIGKDFQLGFMPRSPLTRLRFKPNTPLNFAWRIQSGFRAQGSNTVETEYSQPLLTANAQLTENRSSLPLVVQHHVSKQFTQTWESVIGVAAGQPFFSQGKDSSQKRKDYALLIATSDYKDWDDLKSPINDAKELAKELETSYGFETEIVKDPTLDQVVEVLLRYDKKQYHDFDQLFIFFAGHGTYINRTGQGFLVFSDSASSLNDKIGNTYLSYATLRNLIDGLPCRHIFLVIDACYSGTFDEAIAKTETYRGPEDIPAPSFVDRVRQYRTRTYLTSAGKERSPDGDEGRQSPFAAKLLEALRTYGGKNGYLTITNVLLHVQVLTPRPVSKEWGRSEPGGDFIFKASKP